MNMQSRFGNEHSRQAALEDLLKRIRAEENGIFELASFGDGWTASISDDCSEEDIAAHGDTPYAAVVGLIAELAKRRAP
jgi:hypothetical protein